MPRKKNSLLIDYCHSCKERIKFNEGSVHAWLIYCNSCYDEKVEKGEIIPPMHYKPRTVKEN